MKTKKRRTKNQIVLDLGMALEAYAEDKKNNSVGSISEYKDLCHVKPYLSIPLLQEAVAMCDEDYKKGALFVYQRLSEIRHSRRANWVSSQLENGDLKNSILVEEPVVMASLEVAKPSAISQCSIEELFLELRNRGYAGTLSNKTFTITI